MFSMGSSPRLYNDKFQVVFARSWDNSVEEEFIWVSCQELGRVLEMAVEGDWKGMARQGLGCEKKTSCVIWSDSEIIINPLLGYD
jgi:hypothetical protein